MILSSVRAAVSGRTDGGLLEIVGAPSNNDRGDFFCERSESSETGRVHTECLTANGLRPCESSEGSLWTF